MKKIINTLSHISFSKGISLLELIITIAILGILGSVSISIFAGLANSTSLDRDVSIAVSYMDKARTMAIDSVLALPHGVKLETNKITVFKNTTYSVSNEEASYIIPGKSRISTISLTGGATSFYFNKLTGTPSVTGTVTMKSADNKTTRTIIIYGTGVIDVQ